MITRSSAHVHSQFCDGKSTAAEMAKSAYEKGFVSLGFSTHSPQSYAPAYQDHYSMLPHHMEAYKKTVLSLKEEYKGKMTIYLGLERDYYSAVSPEGFDYYIASVHHLPIGDQYPAIDGNAQDVKDYVDRACGGNALLYVKRYYDLLQKYVCENKPPIIGHFDLVRKNNAALPLFDEESPEYRTLALDALIAMRDSGAILEVNTGAIGRGTLPTPYPAPFLLKKWKALDGEVMINSDCHSAAMIDVYYDESEAMLRDIGFDHAIRLGKDQLWERYEL